MRKARKVILARYLGKWYQQLAYPASFQQGCKDVTAEYLQEPGKDYITVVNRCKKGGKQTSIKGKAFTTGKDNVLLVQFYFPFRARYIIEYVDQNYDFAIVGSTFKQYCWVLSRKKRVSKEMLELLKQKVKQLGYDPGRLVKQ